MAKHAKNGAMSVLANCMAFAALDAVPLLLLPPVVLTAPALADAVAEDPPPAFCEPSPLRPGPSPAPFFMYFSAPVGIAGRAEPVKGLVSQLSPWSGQFWTLPSVEYPPPLLGSETFANADCKYENCWPTGLTSLPEMVTIP
ncbi:hypothetical protein AC579_3592 [Pseudocercospora musae]|uniref:Secreted protein n=1 Tax=Pseudocercospora musae TaxID=113226 RepID=A0A139GU07_9PEZI|nr:hypothetical protein AC579_3592 [Pseudocercospora musae]